MVAASEENMMEFAERYGRALAAADGRHDAALMAAALAVSGPRGELGGLLWRAKAMPGMDDPLRSGPAGAEACRLLARLLHLWTAEVTRQGRARRWMADARPWDAHAAQCLYQAVAEHSLGHWLDPRCDACGGTGLAQGAGAGVASACATCRGTGTAPPACRGGFMRERVRDMVSELHRIADRHARLAAGRLSRN